MTIPLPDAVSITEVGPRDGLQNEALFVETETKIALIDRLAAAGLRRIEAVSFVHPKAIPQMRDAAAVMAGLPRRDGVTYIALVPNEVGARNALSARVDELGTVVSASESHNQHNVRRSIAESLEGIARVAELAAAAGTPWAGYISTAFGCPYEGDVPVAQVLRIAEHLRGLGASGISLGDTIGAANPVQVRQMIEAFRERLPDTPLRLHFHDTRGTGLANVLAALEAGVDSFDASIGGLGGCPYAPGAAGNVATEDLVYMLHQMGIRTGVDLPALVNVAHWIETVVGRPLPGRVKQAGELALSGARHER
jgi:hydroxymethylglutaryl-CoA lyase